jgi:excisionase family DNA binding protein
MKTKDLEQQIGADLARQPEAREDGQGSRKKKNLKPLATDTFSVQEAGRRLGLGKNASYQAAERGELPVLRFGRLLRVPRVAFENLLADAGRAARGAQLEVKPKG